MQTWQNAKTPKYKHDKIQKNKIPNTNVTKQKNETKYKLNKIQMQKNPKYKHNKIQKDKIQIAQWPMN